MSERGLKSRSVVITTGLRSAQTSGRQPGYNRRSRVVCLCTGLTSVLLILVSVVLELLERSWVPLLINATALLLQVVCAAIAWQSSAQKTCPTSDESLSEAGAGSRRSEHKVKSGKPQSGREVTGSNSGSAEGGKILSGSAMATMEQGNAKSVRQPSEKRDARSSKRVAAVIGGGSEADDAASSSRPSALETPLQQVARLLECVLDEYSPDERTREKLEMVLNIISLPEDLNMVTVQSILNADLDSSTTEWIETQLSGGTLVENNAKRGVEWERLRAGLKGVVHRLATEFADDRRDTSGTESGMTPEQLRRQHEVGRAYKMEKTASRRSQRPSTNINVSQLMTLPGARMRSTTLYEVDECSQVDEESENEENAEKEALLELMPRWPGIDPESQKGVVDLVVEKHFLEWGFDIFKLEELSGGHALWYTGMLTLYHYNYVGVFNVSPSNLSRFLAHVEYNYCFNPAEPNPYHTSVHAADVTLTVAHFCENSNIASGINALQGFALIVAAIVHDFRHRGVNNGYLIKVKDELAIIYNDGSVLENFHISEAFKIMYDEKTNLLTGLSVDEMRHFRQYIIKIILATDLAHGFEYVARFTASTNTKGGRRASIVPDMGREVASAVSPGSGTGPVGLAAKGPPPKDPMQAQILLMQMVMKVADVAHPMKPWDLHKKWTELITEEFHRQGDLEIEKGVSVSPLCSREGINQAKSQCDFVNFVVRPCAIVFSDFCKDEVWVRTLESNFRRWQDMA